MYFSFFQIPLQQGDLLEDQVEVSSGLVLQAQEQPDADSGFEQAAAVLGAASPQASSYEVGGGEDRKRPQAPDEGHDTRRDQAIQPAPQLRREILDAFPRAQQHLGQRS